jgi:hypothetical protein
VDEGAVEYWDQLAEVDKKKLWDRSIRESRDLRKIVEDEARRASSPNV